MRKEAFIPYLLILPAALFLLFLFLTPLVEVVLLSFQAGEGWGFQAYQRMVQDLYFVGALKNTLLLAAAILPLQLTLALIMALLVQGLQRGRDLFLYFWTIPLGISDLAAGIIWFSIFTERGYLNGFLQALGVLEAPRLWLSYETPLTLFLAVVVAELWRATALVFVILVAGIQLIPKEYGEAAEVFGASPWKRFVRITLPLLRPSLQAALILRTILAFEVFAVVLALGGRNLPVLAGEAYYWYTAYQNPQVAAAYAVLILLISILTTLAYLRFLRVRLEVGA